MLLSKWCWHCLNSLFHIQERNISERLMWTLSVVSQLLQLHEGVCHNFLTSWKHTFTQKLQASIQNLFKCQHSEVQWVSYTDSIFIQHALNTEKQIGWYFVDSYAKINCVKFVSEFLTGFNIALHLVFCPKTHPPTEAPFEEIHMASEEKLQVLMSLYSLKLVIMREYRCAEIQSGVLS